MPELLCSGDLARPSQTDSVQLVPVQAGVQNVSSSEARGLADFCGDEFCQNTSSIGLFAQLVS